MSDSEWWQGMPGWLKLVYLLLAVPTWLFLMFCVVTDQTNSPAAYVAAFVFFGAALLHIIFDRRNREARNEGGGFEAGD